MTSTQVTFRFLDKQYDSEVEYFEPPGVMPYYKVNISDPDLVKEFGMIHNFKEEIRNGWIVLQPAIDPQGKHRKLFTELGSGLRWVMGEIESNPRERIQKRLIELDDPTV